RRRSRAAHRGRLGFRHRLGLRHRVRRGDGDHRARVRPMPAGPAGPHHAADAPVPAPRTAAGFRPGPVGADRGRPVGSEPVGGCPRRGHRPRCPPGDPRRPCAAITALDAAARRERATEEDTTQGGGQALNPEIRRRRRRVRGSVAVLAVLGLLLAGCSSPLPDVTFYGNRSTSVAGPSLWCAVNDTASAASCAVDRADSGAASLTLRPGQGVVISVPEEVADQPWTLVFKYRQGSAAEQDARTGVFGPGERHAYELSAPAPD